MTFENLVNELYDKYKAIHSIEYKKEKVRKALEKLGLHNCVNRIRYDANNVWVTISYECMSTEIYYKLKELMQYLLVTTSENMVVKLYITTKVLDIHLNTEFIREITKRSKKIGLKYLGYIISDTAIDYWDITDLVGIEGIKVYIIVEH